MGIPPFKEPPKYTWKCVMELKSDFRRPWKFRIYTKVGDLKTYRLGPQQPMEIHAGFFSAPQKDGWKKKNDPRNWGREIHVGFNPGSMGGGCLAMGLGPNWWLTEGWRCSRMCETGAMASDRTFGWMASASGIHPVMKGLHSISRWWQELWILPKKNRSIDKGVVVFVVQK